MLNLLDVQGTEDYEVWRTVVRKIYDERNSSADPELMREAECRIQIKTTAPPIGITFDGDSFSSSTVDPEWDPQTQELVLEHYKDLLGRDRSLEQLVNYLRKNPESKRAIINFWRQGDEDLNCVCPCVIYFWFRVSNDTLDLHAHLRANDVSEKMLLNLLVFRSVQAHVAQVLGLKSGSYSHYVDSAHIRWAHKRHFEALLQKYCSVIPS